MVPLVAQGRSGSLLWIGAQVCHPHLVEKVYLKAYWLCTCHQAQPSTGSIVVHLVIIANRGTGPCSVSNSQLHASLGQRKSLN